MTRPSRWFHVLVFMLLAALLTSPSVAEASKGTSHVKTYTKQNGTVVHAHERKAPVTKSTVRSRHAPRARPAPARKSLTGDRRLDAAAAYLKRSDAARRAFMRQTGYPRGRPGYVVDHIVPLACHGADAPSNMQWQTTEAARQKDRTERIGC